MPPVGNINVAFLSAVFKDEKKLLKNSEVRRVDVPRYPELAVHKVYDEVKGDL